MKTVSEKLIFKMKIIYEINENDDSLSGLISMCFWMRWETKSLFTRSFPKLNRVVYNLSLTRSAIFDFLNIVFPTLNRASSREALIVVIRHFPDIHSTVVPLAEVYEPTACRYVRAQN